ncbi:hypothetical protein GW17_00014390 [Ensete ventricosum]|nr:hypothetical protein GW17_00014390 [Ensete ventricosum]
MCKAHRVDHGGIVRGNAIHADMSREGHDHTKRESIGQKGAEEVENAKANSKYQDRAEAKELHKTDVDELLIKIAESEGLRVDAGVLDQGTK